MKLLDDSLPESVAMKGNTKKIYINNEDLLILAGK